ncbi:MAG TPA: DinB family protein [Thermomicrobiaceae bacterium]|nr:DinB family protein [Thermomicrobiaceae bacterium]
MPPTREDRLSRMRQLPDRVARIIEPAPLEAIRRAGTDGAWGAIEILTHLRDWDEVNLDRVHRILTEDRPALEPVDADLWAIERDYHAQDPGRALASLRQLRKRLVDELERQPESSWERAALDPTSGQVTLDELVRGIDEHDQQHLQNLRDLLL